MTEDEWNARVAAACSIAADPVLNPWGVTASIILTATLLEKSVDEVETFLNTWETAAKACIDYRRANA